MDFDDYEVGFNIPAKIGMKINEIQTPCLVIDYNKFENNILKMKNFVVNNNVKLRPHAKMHKSFNVANYQMKFGGADGICCQKVSEAEVFAREGIKDILITNQITDLFKINRLTNISKANIKISCCVDDEQNIININNSAKEKNTSIDLFIEFDCGANRCGLQSHSEIKNLISLINSLKFVKFVGFQAYNGSIQHIENFVLRKEEVVKTCNKIKELKNFFKEFSPIITGVGTGCFDLEVSENIYDEIQVGSYAFMDAHYSSLKHDNKLNNTNNFENSLFILSSVMSKALDKHAVVDAGLKSISVDSGLPKTNNNNISYIKCSDEHGIIYDPENSLKINDKLYLIPGHCDPTCNLHDWYVIIKNEIVMDLWRVSARGYSY